VEDHEVFCIYPDRDMWNMATNNHKGTADNDHEARMALWAAICLASEQLAGRCSVFAFQSGNSEMPISSEMPIPDVMTWKLVDQVSLLVRLSEFDQ
jgi:hypothetical protein